MRTIWFLLFLLLSSHFMCAQNQLAELSLNDEAVFQHSDMNIINNDFQETIFISNAGITILHPFLATLFEKSGLIYENQFKDEESQSKAVYLLEYAATGNATVQEYSLPINKILCGMLVSDPIIENIQLTEEDKKLVDGLLLAVTQQWAALKNTSIGGLRETFLQREGKLETAATQYNLKVEQKSFDMLMDQIPWNISIIHSKWMIKNLLVTWR